MMGTIIYGVSFMSLVRCAIFVFIFLGGVAGAKAESNKVYIVVTDKEVAVFLKAR